MNDKCFDSGTIQAFLDGELAAETLETVSRHIASCEDCAISLAEAEEESAIAFSALEQEFNTLVPTQRLWTKINDSIQKDEKSFWQAVTAIFSNQATVAFASALIVCGVFMWLLTLDGDKKADDVAEIIQSGESLTVPNIDSTVSKQPFEVISTAAPNIKKPIDKNNKNPLIGAKNKIENRSIKTFPVKTENLVSRDALPLKANPENAALGRSKNVPGEETYIRTIATLEKTVENRKDEVLKPSARFVFERDLAVSDDAIKKMKAEVRKNPKDEAAKQILRASYQNKIDLLNSVADKQELMASLR
jgi:hypothetical protein